MLGPVTCDLQSEVRMNGAAEEGTLPLLRAVPTASAIRFFRGELNGRAASQATTGKVSA
jgi:hypothetical protein